MRMVELVFHGLLSPLLHPLLGRHRQSFQPLTSLSARAKHSRQKMEPLAEARTSTRILTQFKAVPGSRGQTQGTEDSPRVPRTVPGCRGQSQAAEDSPRQPRTVPGSRGQSKATEDSPRQPRTVPGSRGQSQAAEDSPRQPRTIGVYLCYSQT